MAQKNENLETKGETKKTSAKPPQKSHWAVFGQIVLMLVWVAASVIASQLAVGYILIFAVGEDRLAQPVWTTIYSALSYMLALILIIFVPKLLSKKRRRKTKESERELLGLSGLPTWTDIGLAPVGFIVYLLLAAGIVFVFNLFPWFDVDQAQNVGFNFLNSGLDRIVAFITLVVVAPVAEEIIFRGWLYGKLRSGLIKEVSNRASMIISMLLVSILFGLMHMQWNVGVNVFAMSIVLCGLREITGTIYSGMILHMIKNGVAFYLLYVLGVG